MKVRLVQQGVFTLLEEDFSLLQQAPEDGFYWIDVSVDELTTLQPWFNLHELAIEDCLHDEEQRPKLEVYSDHYFIVINSIRFDDEEIFLRPLNIFLGKHWIITATKQKINEIRLFKPKLLVDQVNTPDRLLYHLIDTVINNYFPVADRIELMIEQLEEDILIRTQKSHLNEIIGLRGEILWLKKALGPQKELIATLKNRRDLDLINTELQQYFGDIYENAVKIAESFETFRDLMGNLREAYQSSLHNRANEIMRVFTAMTVIMMPLTVITGIYGMNFTHMPELDWKYGYYIVLAVMVLVGTGIFFFFRKKDWL